jgi:tetratricopeptide (TPR) repeat protein
MARARAEEGLRIAEAAEQPLSIVVAHDGLAWVHGQKGEISTAISLLERGVQLAERVGIPGWSTGMMFRLGYAYALTGRLDEGIPLMVTSLDRLVATRGGHARFAACLGAVYLLLGQTEDARRLASEALDIAQHRGERGYEASALHVRGEIAARGDPSDVEAATHLYRAATALATELGMRPLVAHCHLGLGKLYRRMGKREQAQEHLTTATMMYREMGMTYWLEHAEAELAELER